MRRNVQIGLVLVFALLFAGGIIGLAIKIHYDINKYGHVTTTCQLIACHQSTTLCSGDLCYETYIEFAWIENPSIIGSEQKTNSGLTVLPPCPAVNTTVPCYYGNIANVNQTLTLSTSTLPSNDNLLAADWGGMTILIVGMIITCLFAAGLFIHCPRPSDVFD